MAFYTGIFTIRDSVEVIQLPALNEEHAVREMVGRLPHDDAFDMEEDDYHLLTSIMSGDTPPDLQIVTGRKNIWYWLDGARLHDRIECYLVATMDD